MNHRMLLGLGLSLLACEDPLKSVELVAEPRVLGARVEVEGDAKRAAPAPGERATATFLLAAPELRPSLGFALAACPAAVRRGARSSCAGEPFATILQENGEADSASLSFDVPSNLDPSGRVLLVGVICPSGSPNADGASCRDAASGTSLQLELELAREEDANLNPELRSDSIELDEASWPALEPVAGDCGGLGFPEVDVGTQHSIAVRLEESDRDALPRSSELDPTRESLQLSHFISAGDVTRAFETIAWDSDALDRQVAWTAPDAPGLARFWFVLRDFRGGAAFTERAVCVR